MCDVLLWIVIRQACLGRYIISLFVYNRTTWIQAITVEQVFLKNNLSFNMQGETSIFILPCKNHFDIFVKVAHWLAVQIWISPLTFGTEIHFELVVGMHCESIGSFKDELDIYNWIYIECTIGYSLQLSWNWRAPNRVGFFNGFELFVRLELFRISYFSSKSCFC